MADRIRATSSTSTVSCFLPQITERTGWSFGAPMDLMLEHFSSKISMQEPRVLHPSTWPMSRAPSISRRTMGQLDTNCGNPMGLPMEQCGSEIFEQVRLVQNLNDLQLLETTFTSLQMMGQTESNSGALTAPTQLNWSKTSILVPAEPSSKKS